MLQAQWSREVSYIQRRVMNKWRFAVAEDRRLQHASQQIQRRDASRHLWQAFTAWRAVAKRQHFCKKTVSRAVTRYICRQHVVLLRITKIVVIVMVVIIVHVIIMILIPSLLFLLLLSMLSAAAVARRRLQTFQVILSLATVSKRLDGHESWTRRC